MTQKKGLKAVIALWAATVFATVAFTVLVYMLWKAISKSDRIGSVGWEL